MADEKDPNLDPAKRSDQERPDVDDTATPKAEPHESDPETRMLDQLAQLEDAHADDTPEDTQPASDDPAPIAASRDAHESTADDEPVETPTERTAVLTPLSNEPPPTEPEETVRTKKKRRWPWVVAAIVAVLGIGYVGLAFATQDTLPATLTVEGVDISGM